MILPRESLAQWLQHGSSDFELPSLPPSAQDMRTRIEAVMKDSSPWCFGSRKSSVPVGDQANVNKKSFHPGQNAFEVDIEERVNGRNEKNLSKDHPAVAHRHYYGLVVVSSELSAQVLYSRFVLPCVLWSHRRKEGIEQKGDLFLAEHLLFASELPPRPQREQLSWEGLRTARRRGGGGVSIPQLCAFLEAKMSAYAELAPRPLEDHARLHLESVLKAQAAPPAFNISWTEFAEKSMRWRDKPFTFANWFYDILNKLESSTYMKNLWERGAIIGFMSSEDLRELIKQPRMIDTLAIKFTDSYADGNGLIIWNIKGVLKEARFRDLHVDLKTKEIMEAEFVLCRDLSNKIPLSQLVEQEKTRKKGETMVAGAEEHHDDTVYSTHTVVSAALVPQMRLPQADDSRDQNLCHVFTELMAEEDELRLSLYALQRHYDPESVADLTATFAAAMQHLRQLRTQLPPPPPPRPRTPAVRRSGSDTPLSHLTAPSPGSYWMQPSPQPSLVSRYSPAPSMTRSRSGSGNSDVSFLEPVKRPSLSALPYVAPPMQPQGGLGVVGELAPPPYRERRYAEEAIVMSTKDMTIHPKQRQLPVLDPTDIFQVLHSPAGTTSMSADIGAAIASTATT